MRACGVWYNRRSRYRFIGITITRVWVVVAAVYGIATRAATVSRHGFRRRTIDYSAVRWRQRLVETHKPAGPFFFFFIQMDTSKWFLGWRSYAAAPASPQPFDPRCRTPPIYSDRSDFVYTNTCYVILYFINVTAHVLWPTTLHRIAGSRSCCSRHAAPPPSGTARTCNNAAVDL